MAKPSAITDFRVSAYTVPTGFPESDGTLKWDSTTALVVRVQADGKWGLGYSYTTTAAAHLADSLLRYQVLGKDSLSVSEPWHAMVRAVRNAGRPGLAATAISAVDNALWDLKAKLLDLPLSALLGQVRQSIPVYGSGGFTSYSDEQLRKQFEQWSDMGIRAMKMKIGREPERDPERVCAAREAIGHSAELYVDANGAFSRKKALAMAEHLYEYGVTWFEEPVSSDDLEGLRLLRDRSPSGMNVTAGEYGYESNYFLRMLSAGAVDILQADATRCLGITGFLQAAILASAHHVPFSAHTAPTLHAPVCCSLPFCWNVEYFHDHVRLEELLFDGALRAGRGVLAPRAEPGFGVELKVADAEKFQVYGESQQ